MSEGLVSFDTSPIIWGLQKEGVTDEENILVVRTKAYIRQLSAEDKKILIPAPALGEYLAGFPPDQIEAQQQAVMRSFRVGSYDAHAAAIAAKIMANRKLMDAIRKEGAVDKQRLKIDTEIIAVSVTHGAERLISHDRHLQQLAGDLLLVHEVPATAEQPDLPNFGTGQSNGPSTE
jgi:predicted nucleic acid-binding protein